jgi:hypothetical protein
VVGMAPLQSPGCNARGTLRVPGLGRVRRAYIRRVSVRRHCSAAPQWPQPRRRLRSL